MRTTRAAVELDPSPLLNLLRRLGSAPTVRFNASPRTRGAAHPRGSTAVVPVTTIAMTLALGVATYGVETDRKSVAMIGLTATAGVAAAIAVSARKSIRAQNELHVANEELRQRNADLQAFQLALEQGFGVIDERTQGRLTELVEDVGDELAALVDEALDDAAGNA